MLENSHYPAERQEGASKATASSTSVWQDWLWICSRTSAPQWGNFSAQPSSQSPLLRALSKPETGTTEFLALPPPRMHCLGKALPVLSPAHMAAMVGTGVLS